MAQERKRVYSIIFAILLVSIFLSSCSLFKNDGDETDTGSDAQEKNREDVDASQFFTEPEVIEDDNDSISEFDVAISNVISEGDVSLCATTADETICLINFAVETIDASICKQLTDQRQQVLCTNQVAVAASDVSLCTGEEHDILICKVGILDDESLCSGLDGDALEMCYMAITPKDASWCEEKGKQFSSIFQDTCFLKLALTTGDFSFCEQAGSYEEVCLNES